MVPFKSGMIVVGGDFCGRRKEVTRLSAEIERCSRVCLVGERRIGKTSLVHETVSQLAGHSLVFIDLLGIKSSSDVVRRIVEAIFASESGGGAFSRLLKSFASLRPVAGIDPVTNTPTLTLAPGTKPTPETLETALDYLSKQKQAVVFFDEFQSLLDLPDSEQSDLIARLRSRIQLHADTAYIFAGSIRREMDRIFFDHASPFYKTAIRLELGPIERQEFEAFLKRSFMKGKREITDTLLDAMFAMCHDVPGDMQRLCQCLWDQSIPGDRLDLPNLPAALRRLFSDEERAYTILLEYVTGQQLQCLRALSELGGEASCDSRFLALTGITANSSVQRALNSLINKRIVFRDGTKYRLCDPFFGAWIKHNRW